MRVLIIESDEAFASTLRQALEARGVEVEITGDGDEGIRLAQARPTSAVVLSVELGERLTGGFSWCNRFKRDAKLRDIPLLLTSALATEETFEQHRKLKTRADAYLLKPYGPRDLLNWLEPYLPQPPAPEDDPATFDLAGELLAGLEDPVEEKVDEEEEEAGVLAEVDLLDTDELISDIFDEVEEADGADPAAADPVPSLEVAVDSGRALEVEAPAESEDGFEAGADLEVESEADPEDPTPVEGVVDGIDDGLDAELTGFEKTSPSLMHAGAAMADPPWSDPLSPGPDAMVSGGPALEEQLAALRADAELNPQLRERLEGLERENRRLSEDLASALGASTARETRLNEVEQELAATKAENLTLHSRARLLEEELAAALERATQAEAKLERGSRRDAELHASLAATAALLEEALRDQVQGP